MKVRPCYYLLIITHVVRNPSPSPAPASQDPRLMGPRRLIANVKDRRPEILAQHVLICREADWLHPALSESLRDLACNAAAKKERGANSQASFIPTKALR
jgi:hypothetical protein